MLVLSRADMIKNDTRLREVEKMLYEEVYSACLPIFQSLEDLDRLDGLKHVEKKGEHLACKVASFSAKILWTWWSTNKDDKM